jgi:hypothetical protein
LVLAFLTSKFNEVARPVPEPGQWAWSTFRDYEWDQPGKMKMKLNQWPKAELKRIA